MAEIKSERGRRGARPWILDLLVLVLLAWGIAGSSDPAPAHRTVGRMAAPAPGAAAGSGSGRDVGVGAEMGIFPPLDPRILPAVNPYTPCWGAGAEPGDHACTGIAARHRLRA